MCTCSSCFSLTMYIHVHVHVCIIIITAECLSARQLIMHLKLLCDCMSVRPVFTRPSQLKGRLVMIPMGLSSKWDSFLSITTFSLCVHFLCVGADHMRTSCTWRSIRSNEHVVVMLAMLLGYNNIILDLILCARQYPAYTYVYLVYV